jgi:MFS family permease
MARKVRQLVAGPGAVAAALSARDGLVLEAVEEPTSREPTSRKPTWQPGANDVYRSFGQTEGPLASYRRTVDITPLEGGRYAIRQVVEMRVGLPWWSWLLAPPLRFSLGRVERSQAGHGPVRTRLPWWAPPQRLDRRQAVVLATLAALVSVQGYLAALLPETLTYAASEMHVGTFGQGVVFASVELSALPALFALVMADRRGRRMVVLWATGGAAVLSELGAFAPGVAWLTVTQVAAGALVAAAGIAAIVVAVEEVPRGCRAWAVGVLGMAAGFGGGGPLLLLPLAGTGPGGWRWLYWLSLLTLPVVVVCGQQLPESRRWAAAGAPAGGPEGPNATVTGATVPGATVPGATVPGATVHGVAGGAAPRLSPGGEAVAAPAAGRVAAAGAAGGGDGRSRQSGTANGVIRPLFGASSRAFRSPLARPRRQGPATALAAKLNSPAGRLALVCTGALLFALFAAPAAQYQTQFLRQQRHYSALGISFLQQFAGSIGAFGVLVGGRLADTHGRRPVGVACVIGATAAALWSYLAHGWPLWCAATAAQFFLYATAPVLGVYGAELFATSTRARSAGLVAASSSVGGVAGLLAVGALAAHFGTLAPALATLAVGPLLLVVLLLYGYPETAGMPLEDLAPAKATEAALGPKRLPTPRQIT